MFARVFVRSRTGERRNHGVSGTVTTPRSRNAAQVDISALKTRHVFLDTEVYRRYGHNLNNKVLQRLLQLTKDHISTLHITDITLAEIQRHDHVHGPLHGLDAEPLQTLLEGLNFPSVSYRFSF